MPLLSFFNKDLASVFNGINSNLRSVLNSEFINSVARKYKIHFRNRKMDYPTLVGSSLELANAHNKESLVTIESLRQQYIKDSGIDISPKCFHNRLDQEGLDDFGVELLSSCLKSYAMLCNLGELSIYTELMQELKLDDIILVDGTEIRVRKSLANNCDCKGKFHAGLKLHVAFSLKRQCFEHIAITQAVDSERAQVLPHKYRNVLFIMDAGYVGQELEKQIIDSGNHYLIKGKTNCAGTIACALNDNQQCLHNCYEHRVSAIPELYNTLPRLDLDVIEGERKVRIIRAKNKNRDDAEVFAYLRTSLPLQQASALQIHQLYRLRWIVELFMKCLKSGNSLQGINSSKKEIVLFWICISAMSAVLKSYFAYLAQKQKDIPLLSLLKVHKSPLFSGFFQKLIKLKNSAYYEARNKILELIALNCQRTKPSARDSFNLKDIVLLIKSITKNQIITEWAL